MKAISFFVVGTLVMMASDVCAQATSAAVVTEKPTVSAPKHACMKPVMPEKFTSGAQQDEFQKSVEIFRTCLMEYRNQMQKIAQIHVEAGNAAAAEFNDYIKELNAANEKK